MHPWNCVRLICVSDDVFWGSANDCKDKHHKCGLKINKGMYIDGTCIFNMVYVACYVTNCMMSQWEYLNNNRTDHKIPFPRFSGRCIVVIPVYFGLENNELFIWFWLLFFFLKLISGRFLYHIWWENKTWCWTTNWKYYDLYTMFPLSACFKKFQLNWIFFVLKLILLISWDCRDVS